MEKTEKSEDSNPRATVRENLVQRHTLEKLCYFRHKEYLQVMQIFKLTHI